MCWWPNCRCVEFSGKALGVAGGECAFWAFTGSLPVHASPPKGAAWCSEVHGHPLAKQWGEIWRQAHPLTFLLWWGFRPWAKLGPGVWFQGHFPVCPRAGKVEDSTEVPRKCCAGEVATEQGPLSPPQTQLGQHLWMPVMYRAPWQAGAGVATDGQGTATVSEGLRETSASVTN